VGALRIELNRRDASGGGGGNEIEDMLAKQVEHMLTRQAELAANLAQVRREKELLEVGPDRYCLPRHRMSFNSMIEGSKRVGRRGELVYI